MPTQVPTYRPAWYPAIRPLRPATRHRWRPRRRARVPRTTNRDDLRQPAGTKGGHVPPAGLGQDPVGLVGQLVIGGGGVPFGHLADGKGRRRTILAAGHHEHRAIHGLGIHPCCVTTVQGPQADLEDRPPRLVDHPLPYAAALLLGEALEEGIQGRLVPRPEGFPPKTPGGQWIEEALDHRRLQRQDSCRSRRSEQDRP